MATTSIVDQGNGKYVITDNSGQTRIVDASTANQEAARTGIKVTKPSAATGGNPEATGYNNNAGGTFPGSDTKTVLIKGVKTTVNDAIAQANDVKKLGIIRKNLLASGQLTKAEAKDPNSLLSKWAAIVYGAANDSNPANNDPFVYAKALQSQGFGSTYGTQQYEPYGQATTYTPEKATAFVISQFKDLLHREPTAEEVTSWTNKLIKQQNKPSAASKTTYKMVNGVRTAVTSTPVSPTEWFTSKITATPEYKQIQSRLNSVAAQQLQAAAAANGVKIDANQLSDWTNRVAKGESVETFKAILRDQAGLGMPDQVKKLLGQGVDLQTIYSPYKQTMAKVLEINPETITLDDPVLRSAINQTGETSLYDFQRGLRKDPRWQYTNNAREEVSNSVMQVLKDFGFRG